MLVVWTADLDDPPLDPSTLLGFLSQQEREQARPFRRELDRRRFMVGRGLVRALLGRSTGVPPAELRFRYGSNGKPSLVSESHDQRLSFNVTHSERLLAVALSRSDPVGVDLEVIRPLHDGPTVARQVFTPNEQAELAAMADKDWDLGFYRLWTGKEAFLKANGWGLAVDPREIEVSLETAMALTLVSGGRRCPAPSGWSLVHFFVDLPSEPQRAIGTVAVPRKAPELVVTACDPSAVPTLGPHRDNAGRS